jgi:hypothetical protein
LWEWQSAPESSVFRTNPTGFIPELRVGIDCGTTATFRVSWGAWQAAPVREAASAAVTT